MARGERSRLVESQPKPHGWRQRAHVVWWCVALAVLYGTERTTFKVLVDRLGPYRYVMAQAVLVCYLIVYLAVTMRKLASSGIPDEMHGFPKHKLAVMALLDYIQLIVTSVAAGYMAPTLTALLLQLSVPVNLVVGIASGRPYSVNHYVGAILILFSGALCLYRPISDIAAHRSDEDDQVQIQSSGGSVQSQGGGKDMAALLASMGWSTVVYAIATLPSAASAAYKERALSSFGRAMDPEYLAMWLTAGQLLLAVLTAPLAFQLQGLLDPRDTAGDGATAAKAVRDSLRQGWQCWLLMEEPSDAVSGPSALRDSSSSSSLEADAPHCSGALFLVLAHVAATLFAAACVSRVLAAVVGLLTEEAAAGGGGANSGTSAVRAVYRSITVGLLLAFVALATYAGYQGTPWVEESVNVLTGVGLVTALAGLEIYHCRPEPEAEMITTYNHNDAQSANDYAGYGNSSGYHVPQ